MITLTPEEIKGNWDTLIGYINTHINDQNRKSNLLKMYSDFEDRLAFMPASAVEHHHSAYPGGYVEHVIRVIEASLQIMKLWSDFGSPLNFTEEELVFVALNHDLGKYGSITEPYYIPNESEWHRKNQGKIYEYNPNLSKMPVQDRSLYLLQHYGITMSETEYIAIKTHDGLYDDGNKSYLITYSASQKPKSSLLYVLHQADMMAARIEFEMWRDDKGSGPATKSKTTKPNQSSTTTIPTDSAKAIFKELFD